MCRGEKVSRAKKILVSFFDNRVDTNLKGTCTRSPYEHWHPPECQCFKSETGCKATDSECSGCCETCTTNGFCLARLGEVGCEKYWDQFDEYDSRSLRFVKQVSGKKKGPSLGKIKSKFHISEVPTLRNLKTDLRKRLKV